MRGRGDTNGDQHSKGETSTAAVPSMTRPRRISRPVKGDQHLVGEKQLTPDTSGYAAQVHACTDRYDGAPQSAGRGRARVPQRSLWSGRRAVV